MSRIPGLNYAQPTSNSKSDGRQSRSCLVVEADASRCVVTFQLKGSAQRAVLPRSRLFAQAGPCADARPPVVGEKLNCDMTAADYRTLNAQWLVHFAWRGKMDSSNKASQSLLQGVNAMITELSEDAGVTQFVAAGGGRERCAFARAALETGGAALPASQPLWRHLELGRLVVVDCQRSSVVPGCRYVAEKVFAFSESSDPEEFADAEDDIEDLYPARPTATVTTTTGGSGYIHRTMIKDAVGRVVSLATYKAVLAFEHAGQQHRALLLTAKFTFSDKATAQDRRDLTRVLAKGDTVVFTCHEYDKPDGSDRCAWWVMEARKLEPTAPVVGREAGYFNQGLLYEKIGQVTEVFPAEGLLRFVLDQRREVAWFSVAEVYIDGRPCAQQRLSDVLENGMRMNFNAKRALDRPRGADWRCTCVWRGDQPDVEKSQQRLRQTVAKKPKKSKSSRSTMNDLDDFDVPELPAAEPQEAESRVGGQAQMAGGDALCTRSAQKTHLDSLDDVDESSVGADGDRGWGAPVDGSAGRAGAGSAPLRPLMAPWRSDRPSLVPLRQPPAAAQLRSSSESAPSSPESEPHVATVAPSPKRLPPTPAARAAAAAAASCQSHHGTNHTNHTEQSAEHNGAQAVGETSATAASTSASQVAPQWPAAVSAESTQPQPVRPAPSVAGSHPPPGLAASALPMASLAERQRQDVAALSSLLGIKLQDRTNTQRPPPPPLVPAPPPLIPAPPPLIPAPPLPSAPHLVAAIPPSTVPGGVPSSHYASAPTPAPLPAPAMPSVPHSHHLSGGTPAPAALMPSVPHSHHLSGPPGLQPPAQQWLAMYSAGIPSQPAPSAQQLLQQHVDQQRLQQHQLRQQQRAQQRQQQESLIKQVEQERLSQQRVEQDVDQASEEQPTVWSSGDGCPSAGASSSSGSASPGCTPTPGSGAPQSTRDAAILSQLVRGAQVLTLHEPRRQQSGDSAPPSPPPAGDNAPPSPPRAGDSALPSPPRGGDSAPPTPPREDDSAAAEPVSGTGVILAFADERRGLAEWERDGRVDQVMFERQHCFWLGAPMDALDLTDCYSAGELVSFKCVRAPADSPYQWVATEMHQLDE